MEEDHNHTAQIDVPLVHDQNWLRGPFKNVADYEEGQDIANKLWDCMKLLGERALGLAAPQIGIPKRVAVIRHPLMGNRVELINPRDCAGSGPVFISREKCFSLDCGESYPVPRYSTYSAAVLAPEGHEELVYGTMASDDPEDTVFCQALQHEIDHLDGRVLKDYRPGTEDPYVIELMDLALETQKTLLTALHTPYRRDSAKIGRNTPCPCNSGKKYKRCCMRS